MSNGGGRLRSGGVWGDCRGRWINHTTSGGGGGGWRNREGGAVVVVVMMVAGETKGAVEEAVEAGGSEMVIIEPVYRWIPNLLK